MPIALRVPTQQALLEVLNLKVFPIDIAANVLGYVPLGIVLRSRGVWSALLISALLSVFAEMTQVFTLDRMPALVDVATNLLGASLGLLVPRRLRIVPEQISIGPGYGLLAAAAAVAYVLVGSSFTVEAVLRHVRVAFEAPPWMSTNPRGSLVDGTVEARLSFERIDNDMIADASANRLRVTAVNKPSLSPGQLGSAILLNGQQWVDLGNPVALRLTGSMTLSAWVRATRFPVDDAVIISTLTDDGIGYQLDLTIDQGPRTIGFKLADDAGRLIARFGKTPIATDRWYHVAGVYDARFRTLDVYVNGILDNGCLIGTITGRQLPSGRHTFVGRRAGMRGFEFIGSIDEALIESTVDRPIEAQSKGAATDDIEVDDGRVSDFTPDAKLCTDGQLPRIAGPFVVLGMLISLACTGLVSGRRYPLVSLGICLAAGIAVAYMAPLTNLRAAAWPAILFVPLGGSIVLAAARGSRPAPG